MRKTIMLGTLIALFSAGALAHARDVTTTEPGAATEAARPAVRGQDDARERHHEYRSRRGTTRPVTATANIMTKPTNATTRAGNTAGAADRHRNQPTDGTPEAR